MATTRGWSRSTTPGRIKARLRGVGVVAHFVQPSRARRQSAVLARRRGRECWTAPLPAPDPGAFLPPRRGPLLDCE